jgi:hypothetical protein
MLNYCRVRRLADSFHPGAVVALVELIERLKGYLAGWSYTRQTVDLRCYYLEPWILLLKVCEGFLLCALHLREF